MRSVCPFLHAYMGSPAQCHIIASRDDRTDIFQLSINLKVTGGFTACGYWRCRKCLEESQYQLHLSKSVAISSRVTYKRVAGTKEP
jgi:hypothetical protein